MAQLDPPTTIPRLHPIPEHRADPDLAATYHDVTSVLGVPWVGVVIQALAHYRPFFDRAYAQLRPSLACHYVERAATDLRLLAWHAMTEQFSIADQAPTLREHGGYSGRERTRRDPPVARHLRLRQPQVLPRGHRVREALLGNAPIGATQPDPTDLLPRAPVQTTGVATMLEEHHADASLRTLYEDMKTTLGLPFVNSDYKAMARWPTYLTLAWDRLKPALDTEPYRNVRHALNDACVHAAHEIPHRYHLHRGELDGVGLSQAQIDELVDVTRLFQWLLSGLILNVTYCKIALHGGS